MLSHRIHENISRWLRYTFLTQSTTLSGYAEKSGIGRTKLRALTDKRMPSSLAKDLALIMEVGETAAPPLSPPEVMRILTGGIGIDGADADDFGTAVADYARGMPYPRKQALVKFLSSPQIVSIVLDNVDLLEENRMALPIIFKSKHLFSRLLEVIPALEHWVEAGCWTQISELIKTRAVQPHRGKERQDSFGSLTH